MTYFGSGPMGKRQKPTKLKAAAPCASTAPVEDASDGGGDVPSDQFLRPAPTAQKG